MEPIVDACAMEPKVDACSMEPIVVACPLIEPVVGPVFMNMYQTECDIREYFDTNVLLFT